MSIYVLFFFFSSGRRHTRYIGDWSADVCSSDLEALGLDFLVSHPGNYMDEREAGLVRNAEGIAEGLARVPGRTLLLMETTAGAGTVLGATFEELARLIELVPEPLRARVGVCLDTAHVFAAGYDLTNDY